MSNRVVDLAMLESVLWSVGAPAFLGVLAIGIVTWRLRGSRLSWLVSAVTAAILGGVAAGSFVVSVGWPSFPPSQKWHGVFWMSGVLAGIGVLDALAVRGDWASRCVLAVFAGLASVWLLPLPGQTPFLVGVSIGCGVFLVGLLDAARGGIPIPLGGWAAASVASLLALSAGTMTLALMAGSVAACLGGLLVLGWIWPRWETSGSRSGGATLGGVLAMLVVTSWAYDYDTVPAWAWLGVWSGFAIACILEIGTLGRWTGRLATAVRAAVLLVPPGLVVMTEWDLVKGAVSG